MRKLEDSDPEGPDIRREVILTLLHQHTMSLTEADLAGTLLTSRHRCCSAG